MANAPDRNSIPAGKLLFYALLAGAVVYGAQYGRWHGSDKAQGLRGELVAPDGKTRVRELDLRGVSIVMYSLTTCGYCTELRRIFEANNVPFREYFIDSDPARMEEFQSKLAVAGLFGAVGTPTLEVNGVMLPNNPPIADILRAATGGVYTRRG